MYRQVTPIQNTHIEAAPVADPQVDQIGEGKRGANENEYIRPQLNHEKRKLRGVKDQRKHLVNQKSKNSKCLFRLIIFN